ncbi:MAG: hypothetical protein ACK4V2_07550 [Pseudomonadota bacterium]|jgi:hypothetical protein|nr:hypothetical protein [Alphaproteobacteria bacterium]
MDMNCLTHCNYFTPVVASLILLLAPMVLPIIRKFSGVDVSKIASVGGGMAIAAVFVFMVPDVIAKIKPVSAHTGIKFLQQEHHLMCVIFITFLAAFCLMYALEKIALDRTKKKAKPDSFVFYFHMAVLGAMLIALTSAFPALASSTYAIFIVCVLGFFEIFLEEIALVKHFKTLYSKVGRYIVMLAILIGLGLGVGFFKQESTVFTLLTQAFVIGMILTAVIKNEFDIINQSNNYSLFIMSVIFKTAIIFYVMLLEDASSAKNINHKSAAHHVTVSHH